MLFDPLILIQQPLAVLATLAIILFGKSLAAFFLVRLFGHSQRTALTIAASLAQIGEFAFILAGLGMALNLLPQAGQNRLHANKIASPGYLAADKRDVFPPAHILLEPCKLWLPFLERPHSRIGAQACNTVVAQQSFPLRARAVNPAEEYSQRSSFQQK